MTSREIVKSTIRFEKPPRLPCDFPEQYGYGSDFFYSGMSPSLDMRLRNGTDEWGSVWSNKGNSNLGEVKKFPLKTWRDLQKYKIPDINAGNRFECMKNVRETAGEQYLLCGGISIYERVHFLRGIENTWTDIYDDPENLCVLLDVLVDLNLETIKRYAQFGVDGYIFCDDWGLQNTLMINPVKWREIWKPRYKKIFDAVHYYNMDTFLHSCGYIIDILDDLIEVGLDVIHMDQQENMGLELLGQRFGGRLTFFSGADIQTVLPNGNIDRIREYCKDMKRFLSTAEGGFIPRWYTDPVGAGHSKEAVCAMCNEFLK